MNTKLQAEIRREMESCCNCHLLFDSEDYGAICWDFDYSRGGFVAGSACNTGLLVDFFHKYDPVETFDGNLWAFYEDAQEHYGIHD